MVEPIQQKIKKPINLLLIGFPKCGTTSLATQLSLEENIFVTTPKETFLFCQEFPFFYKNSISQFKIGDEKYICEASSINIYSSKLFDMCKDEKIIIMFRDYQGGYISWFNQLKNNGYENRNIDNAWYDSVSGNTKQNEILSNYSKSIAYGYWIDKWVKKLGNENVLLINQKELINKDNRLSKKLSKFLSVEISATEFPKLNEYTQVRSINALRLLRTPYIKRFWYKLEQRFVYFSKVRTYIRYRVFAKKISKEKLNSKLERQISCFFEDDLKLLGKCYEENNKMWG